MAIVDRSKHMLLALWVLTASPAWAQPSQGATVLDSDANLSFTASGGYRFNSAMGLGIEVTFVPTLEPDFPFAIPTDVYGLPPLRFGRPEGRATVFTTNLRLEMPTTVRRIVPFALAGGGVASLRERYDVTYSFPSPLVVSDLAALGLLPTIPRTLPMARSSVAMALTLGGGVSVMAGEHLSVDVDLRYLRLLGDTDRNIGRFGVGASYRF
jgi:opacity protein-like surface antigen